MALLRHPALSRSVTLPALTLVFLTLALTLVSRHPGPVAAQSAALFVHPAAAAPGAELIISGPGFTPGAAVSLLLACLGQDVVLPAATADANGVIQVSAVLPPVPAGSCLLQANDPDGGPRETTFTTRPPLLLSVNPAAGPPGTSVAYNVRGLAAGQLLLLYDGAPLGEPISVGDGPHSGAFVVPNDRPAPLGGDVVVEAVNRVGGRVVGRAQVTFASAPAPARDYALTDVVYDLDGVAPGETFTITGRIAPPPDGPPESLNLAALWRKPDGRAFLIHDNPPTIAANGQFSITAHLPSLAAGDPELAEMGDSLAITLLNKEGQSANHVATPDIDLVLPSLKVKVVDAETQQPVTGALVSFVPWDSSMAPDTNDTLSGPDNQISGVDSFGLTPEEQFLVMLHRSMCKPQPIPTNETPLELINPALDFTLLQPHLDPLTLASTHIINGATRDGALHENRLHYLLTIDAVAQEYGELVGTQLKPVGRRIDFDMTTNTYYDAQTGEALPNPLTVALNKVPSGFKTLGEPTLVGFEGTLPQPGSNPLKPAFGHYYSLVNLPNTTIPESTTTKFKIFLWRNKYNMIDSNGVSVFIDGQPVGKVEWLLRVNVPCDMFKGLQGTGYTVPNHYEGTAYLPNLHKLSPGSHTVRLAGKLKTGESFEYFYELRVSALPATWFDTPSVGQRVAKWTPFGASLQVDWVTPASGQQVLNTEATDAETKETGPLYNTTKVGGRIVYEIESNSHAGAQTGSSARGEVINEDGSCALNGTMNPTCPPTARAADEHSFGFGPTTQVVMPEVTYNIPGFYFGIPLVAEAMAGGSVSYEGLITAQGHTTVKDDSSVEAEITLTPWARISGGLWIHAYIATGILFTGKTELEVGFDVGMPITYHSNDGVSTGDMCFEYFSDLHWYTGSVCCPYGLCGCVFEEKDTENLFNGEVPNGCAIPNQLAGRPAPVLALPAEQYAMSSLPADAAPRAPAAEENKPPLLGTDLAANGFGTIMAIWQQSENAIAAATYDGATWSQAATIPAGWGAHNPQVAYTGTSTAVAVWTETDLQGATLEDLPNLRLREAMKHARIAAATFDGAKWSPAQPLTVPQYGEGGVALAGCPNWQPACAAEGVSAVAVWERVMTNTLDERRIRLYWSKLTATGWSSPAPVLPHARPTDVLPQVAFLNGRPLLAWVRDSDTDLVNNTSRRVALLLPGATQPLLPTALPNGIGEIALAVDENGIVWLAFTRGDGAEAALLTNERPLWLARGACTPAGSPTSCAWQVKELVDSRGRPLFAEHPVLTLNQQQPVITFRGTGFGGNLGRQPEDAPGMISGFGDLAQVVVEWSGNKVSPTYLTQDGAVNWLPSAAYDPVLDVTLTMATVGTPPVGLPQTRATGTVPAARAANPLPMLPLTTSAVSNLADLAVVEVSAESTAILPGSPPEVTVRVQNSGAPITGATGEKVVVRATWDGGPGAGAPAGQTTLSGLGVGQAAEVTLPLTLPPGASEMPHTLTVTVNPEWTIAEQELANNQLTIDLGDVPAPYALSAQVKPGGSLVFLTWPAVDDPRLGGYLVYRQTEGGAWQAVGSAFETGWVDQSAEPDRRYTYAVAAYTRQGYESPRSLSLAVRVPPAPASGHIPTFLPIVRR